MADKSSSNDILLTNDKRTWISWFQAFEDFCRLNKTWGALDPDGPDVPSALDSEPQPPTLARLQAEEDNRREAAAVLLAQVEWSADIREEVEKGARPTRAPYYSSTIEDVASMFKILTTEYSVLLPTWNEKARGYKAAIKWVQEHVESAVYSGASTECKLTHGSNWTIQ